jgi:carbamoyltransferase
MSTAQAENKDIINARVKFREPFRPFCPSLIAERTEDYLSSSRKEPFMITSFNVQEAKRIKIPAVVHVDGTVRPQTVLKDVNPLYWDMINRFGEISGEYVLLNTSMNIRGEPIVCHPREAIRCFYDTGLDALVMGSFILEKNSSQAS